MKTLTKILALVAVATMTLTTASNAVAQGSISGVVTDASTGDVIDGARVFARGDEDRGFGRTGEDGSFELTDLAAGTYTVTVFSRGYVPQDATVEVVDGENTAIDFALEAPAFGGIEGVVTDGDGNPVEDAFVRIRRDHDDRSSMRTRTDENGFYSFEDLREGDYMVSVYADGFFPADAEVLVEGDSVSEVNFELESLMFGGVEGVVTDADGLPVPNARVAIRQGRGDFGRIMRTDENGFYSFEDVLAGDYTIYVAARGFFRASADVEVIADETSEANFTLEALAFGAVSGFVTDAASGDPIENAFISAGRNRTRTDDTGFYVIENVVAGTTRVRAAARGYDRVSAEVEVVGDETTMQDFALESSDDE